MIKKELLIELIQGLCANSFDDIQTVRRLLSELINDEQIVNADRVKDDLDKLAEIYKSLLENTESLR